MSKYLEKIYNLPDISDNLLSKFNILAKKHYHDLVADINNGNIAALDISSKTDDLNQIQHHLQSQLIL